MRKLVKVVTAFDIASYKVGRCTGDRTSMRVLKCDSLHTLPASKSALSDHERAEAVADFMLSAIKADNSDRVVIENNRFSFKGANRGLQEYYVHGNIRIVQRYCLKKKIPCEVINFNTILSAICGPKKEVQNKQELERRVHWMLKFPPGFQFANDDESDAAGYFLYDCLALSNFVER